MDRKDDAAKRILHYINISSEFSCEEKQVWSDIVYELLKYQDETLNCIESKSLKPGKEKINTYTGITSAKSDTVSKLKDGLFYMSAADDIEADCPLSNIMDLKKRERKDGEWFVIGTGYLDCEYDKVCSFCGRDKSYTGISPDGEFEYSLVLKNTLLHREKILYKIAEYYEIEEPSVFAPMLRRFVYIETRSDIRGEWLNLQLEKNKLCDLLIGWKSVWNVNVIDKPDRIRTNKGYNKFVINEQNEYMYILPEDDCQNKLSIKQEFDSDKHEKYYIVSSDTMDDAIFQVCIPKTRLNDIDNNEYKLFSNFGDSDSRILRIYSKSDIFSFLKSYSGFLKCVDVFTKYPENLKIFEYEYGFEYPSFTDYLSFSKRPVIYLAFEKSSEKFLFDRIVYVIHILQRKFPEYIWKGGFFDE